MSAAIYFHPEAYSIDGPRLMGRHAAGESFLRAFLSYVETDSFFIQVQQRQYAQAFKDAMLRCARTEPLQVVDKTTMHALSQPGAVFYPGPDIGKHAFHRAAFGHTAWSVCGITHTTSSAQAMDGIADLLTKPIQPWDALICTSQAVKHNVSHLLQAQADYLSERLGARKMVLPQLPVIPLGVHAADFEFTEAHKQQARQDLGLTPNDVVVLFMGRLSFHAKAHPLAMYQALEQAAQRTQKNIVLVECGWYANDSIANAFTQASQLACPSVRVVGLNGQDSQQRKTAWACADVFCSLSDNIQETFGIVPLEAMAAGLPVVVSDWDGYKDTVRDGVDGFRIPTWMPAPQQGGDLALRHALEVDTYDMYCGHACALVAVDVAQAAQAFVRLFNEPALRQQMGQAGQMRVQALFDWRVVITQYQALWQELHHMRTAAKSNSLPASAKLKHPWPARMDPFTAFENYPTHTLLASTLLQRSDANEDEALQRLQHYLQLAMVSYAKAVLAQEKELQHMLSAAAQPTAASQLVAALSPQRQPIALRSLVWLMKLGLLRAV
jgi:glycosyltransferase involved in cell wall biosynthesis